MARNDREICRMFIEGLPPKQSLFSRTNGSGPWGGSNIGALSHALSASVGTYRLGYSNDTLWSYGHYALAFRYVRKDKVTIIVNADGAPTMTTSRQMTALRMALHSSGVKVAMLPYSALFEADINTSALYEMHIVNTTADYVKSTPAFCEHKGSARLCVHGKEKSHEFTRQQHFLGETLFHWRNRYYVCGLDRNDDPNRRNFYLARLRRGVTPRTVDQALKALRPDGLPKTTLRQGEWFLVPQPKTQVSKSEIFKDHEIRGQKIKRVPIISDFWVEMSVALFLPGSVLEERSRRHAASQMVPGGLNEVLVRGSLWDSEHGRMKLGDGKTWYRVKRNLADGSWGAARDKNGRGRVD